MKLTCIKLPWLAVFIGLISIWAGIILINLDNTRLYEWDECVYAQYAKEMKQTGNFLYYTWNGTRIFEKPPLYGWLMQLPYLFGVNEFTARILSLIAGILTAGITYLIGVLLFSKRTAFFAGSLLLTSYIFTVHSRFVTTDTLVMMFFVLDAYFLLQAHQKKINMFAYIAGICFAAAFMQKGAHLFIFQAGLYAGLFIHDRKALGPIIRSGLISMLLILPWHIYMYMIYGYPFIYEYIVENLIIRSTRIISFQSHSLMFLYYIARDYMLWIGYLIFLFIDKQKKKGYIPVIWMAALIPFLIFSFAFTTRHINYILPIFPFIALSMGYSIEGVLLLVKHQKLQQIIQVTLSIILIGQALYTSQYVVHNYYMVPGLRQNLYDVYDAIHKQPQKDVFYLSLASHRDGFTARKEVTPVSLHNRYSPTPCIKYYTDKKIYIYYSLSEFNTILQQTNGLYLISKTDTSRINRSSSFSVIYNNADFELFLNDSVK